MELISRQSTKRPQADYVSILTYVLLCVFVKIGLVRMCVCVCMPYLFCQDTYASLQREGTQWLSCLLLCQPANLPALED